MGYMFDRRQLLINMRNKTLKTFGKDEETISSKYFIKEEEIVANTFYNTFKDIIEINDKRVTIQYKKYMNGDYYFNVRYWVNSGSNEYFDIYDILIKINYTINENENIEKQLSFLSLTIEDDTVNKNITDDLYKQLNDLCKIIFEEYNDIFECVNSMYEEQNKHSVYMLVLDNKILTYGFKLRSEPKKSARDFYKEIPLIANFEKELIDKIYEEGKVYYTKIICSYNGFNIDNLTKTWMFNMYNEIHELCPRKEELLEFKRKNKRSNYDSE